MMPQNTHSPILVLPSWYPSKIDQFSGDFIQRHVKAISLFRTQYVIYVIKDERGKFTSDVTTEEMVMDNYTEKIIYYHLKKTGIGILDKLLSHRKYTRIYSNAIKLYIKTNGCPDFMHVHVALKAGMIALWTKNKWNIPFILSEHWTVYLGEADLRVEHFRGLHRRTINNIFKQAAALTVVSDWLGKAILNKFSSVKYQVIPNVVDNRIFFPAVKLRSNAVQFIHASTMNYQKNAEDILKALKILKENKYDFVLNLYGPVQPTVQELIDKLDLKDRVFLKGEVPQLTLAKEMQQSDALILYSRFETFGCVLIEANATGIPVIVSDIPVFHELVIENKNGLFAQGANSEALAEKLIEFISKKGTFDTEQIVKTTEKYNYATVGKQFDELYRQFTK